MVVGSLTVETDVVVIGSGPGGYVAAIRAAQLGKEVMVVEESKKIGGVCLHVGCIPTKALIHASYAFNKINTLTEMGVTIKDYELNLPTMMNWKDGVITQLENGIKHLFKKYGIEVIEGRGTFGNSNTLHIEGKSDVNTITFKDAIVATGSSIIELPTFPFSEERIIGSTDLIKMDHVPKKIVIIGGGYIGTELATVYAKLGSEIHLIEAQERILSVFEPDIDEVISKKLESLGVTIHTNCKALGYENKGDSIIAKLEENGKNITIEAEYIATVVGRKPNTKNIGLENTKVSLDDKGFVHVDDQMRTADPHIFAIGDIVGQPMLAHKATKEGKVAAESICGLPAAFDNQVIPAVVFNDPEIMTVGLTKAQAESKGMKVKEGKFPYRALGRALTMNAPEGFIKIVAEEESERVIGVHAIGPHVSDITGEAVLAIEMGATLDDIALSIHAHPTVSESLAEVAEVAKGSAIHIFQEPKKN